MSVFPTVAPLDPAQVEQALTVVAAGAGERDRTPGPPPFPSSAVDQLGRAGLLSATVPGDGGERSISFADELRLVQAVARADAAVGRIYDGHLNAVERLAVQAEPTLRRDELAAVAAGELRLGVWGADPAAGEGEPARIDGDRVVGVKVFCSGAGGLDRALVLVRGPADDRPLRLAYIDLSDGVEVDERWYRAAGMRASASHRVVFHGAPLIAVLGEAGAISAAPWFSRDAIRTAATWAGIAAAAADAALATLAARPDPGPLEGLAAGRIATERRTIELWLADAGRRIDDEPQAATATLAATLRDAVSRAARRLIEEAASATGSRPLAAGGDLDRARRDLDVFLLQHRLDPIVARAGIASLEQRAQS